MGKLHKCLFMVIRIFYCVERQDYGIMEIELLNGACLLISQTPFDTTFHCDFMSLFGNDFNHSITSLARYATDCRGLRSSFIIFCHTLSHPLNVDSTFTYISPQNGPVL